MRHLLSLSGLGRTLLVGGVVCAALALAVPAAAENEWDEGSPPPQDFGFQQTAEPSGTSAYNWLYSADGGAAVYDSWTTNGVNTSQLSSVSGGVATGMTTATAARAGSGR